jgi:TPR repeat protein
VRERPFCSLVPTSFRQVLSMVALLLMMGAASCGRTSDSSTRSELPTADEQAVATRRRAEAGEPFQQMYLGLMYFEGDHVPQDYVRSYMWLNIAAARVPKESRSDVESVRGIVAEKLTPAQVVEAQKRASEWMDAFERRQK